MGYDEGERNRSWICDLPWTQPISGRGSTIGFSDVICRDALYENFDVAENEARVNLDDVERVRSFQTTFDRAEAKRSATEFRLRRGGA